MTGLVNDGRRDDMEPKFLALDQDKQDRILNAAMEEFARNGYKNTSTNKIVKQAGISKGLLFHYFSNKKELYLMIVRLLRRLVFNGDPRKSRLGK